MAVKERKADLMLEAANMAITKRLISRLEAAFRAGTLKPLNPDAKSVTSEIRVKVK